ncbi:MAG: type II toxin-antitoxin system RelE/ParE family toxin [Firmicutes bacterium]|nr:type II toxin-antitoxin system RelE/ParE family toxin [Bacillota bacterium]
MKNDKNPSPVRYRIDISEPAENDLREIVRYISAQLSAPMTAMEMLEAMEQTIVSLEEMPHRASAVADERLASIGYRKLIVKNYIIFFSIDEKAKVDVERILYGRRNWRAIL